jgi:predicted RNase H-like HicB family nuclease
MTNHYHINVFWHDADQCWIANVPDLEGCSAHGDDPRSAVREALEAMDEWIASANEHGDPIPEPRYRAVDIREPVAA